MKTALVVGICLAIGLSPSILHDAIAAPQSGSGTSLSNSEISDLKNMLNRDQRELRDFQGLIRDLESAAKESSGARRQKTIDKLQEAMAREIIQAEENLNKDYFLRIHGEVSKRDASSSVPQGTSAVFTPEHQRLTYMQSIYRVCSRGTRRAVNKESQGVENYLQKVKDFAVLMQTDIQRIKNRLEQCHGEQLAGGIALAERFLEHRIWLGSGGCFFVRTSHPQ